MNYLLHSMENETQKLKRFYKRWYTDKVEEKFTMKQKLNIMRRISELRHKSSLCRDQERNYIDQFPELKPYSSKGKISGLQLCVVMDVIFEELHFPA